MNPHAVAAGRAALAALTDLINRTGVNYRVGLDLVPGPPADTPEAAVAAALGPDVLDGAVTPTDLPAVLDAFEHGVRYWGCGRHHPGRGVAGSRGFQTHAAAGAVAVEQLAAEAAFIGAFRARPRSAYSGVMWEFGFVLTSPAGVVVLTGWSSD